MVNMSTDLAKSLHKFDSESADLILEYVRERLMIEAPLDHPGDKTSLERAIAGLINPTGTPVSKVLDVYAEVLAPTVLSTDSPKFLAFIPGAPAKSALLFDTVVSCASLQGMSWLEAAGAIVAENQVLRWIADLAGMPASAGGTFVSGGSAANLSALAVAREVGRQRTGARHVRIALSHEAHSSIGSTLKLLDVEPVWIETDNHKVTAASFARTLAADTGSDPIVAVALTAGTTNAGIIDDLAGVGEIARAHNMWLHVDGAYGGAGLLSPTVRHFYDGIEHADSFITDPHKWWFAPFDAAAILYRNPELAVQVHTQDASYLDVLHDDQPQDQFNPTDLAYHLTRRARGLALWFAVAVHGTDAFAAAVERGVQLARETVDVIAEYPEIELLRDPTLSVVLWRRKGWEKKDYENLQAELLREQIAFVTPSKWEGETVGRFAFLHPETEISMVREIFNRCR
jgi:glutamate/tyrosine decarboxylase-like PLP-dependent enzyme